MSNLGYGDRITLGYQTRGTSLLISAYYFFSFDMKSGRTVIDRVRLWWVKFSFIRALLKKAIVLTLDDEVSVRFSSPTLAHRL